MRTIAIVAALTTLSPSAAAVTIAWSKLPRAATLAETTRPELGHVVLEGGTVRGRDGHKVCFGDGARRFEKSSSLPNGTPLVVEELVQKSKDSAELVVHKITGEAGKIRVIGERRVSLARVAKAPTGVEVFAARGEDDRVDFLVTEVARPKRLKNSAFVDARQFIQDEIGGFATSTCGFVHVELDPKRRRAVTVRNNVILSSAPRVHNATADVRLRGMYAHLGVSKLRADRQPVVSVSFGWATAESIVEAPLEDE